MAPHLCIPLVPPYCFELVWLRQNQAVAGRELGQPFQCLLGRHYVLVPHVLHMMGRYKCDPEWLVPAQAPSRPRMYRT